MGNYTSKISMLLKDKEKLWKCFRSKEAKETWQANAVLDPRVILCWRKSNVIWELIRSVDRLEYRWGTEQQLNILQASLVAQMVKRLPTMRETQVWSWVGEIPWRRKWHPTPVLLPGKSHGQRSLVGYSPWGPESQTWLSDFTFTLNILQYGVT